MIVPFAVGGPADITGAIVARHFHAPSWPRVIVENINGAGGNHWRGSRRARERRRLHHLFRHTGTNALAPAFYPDIAYDPQKDFEPIGLTAEYPEVLVVRKDLPAKNLAEFVAYARPTRTSSMSAMPGSVRYPISDVSCSTRNGDQAGLDPVHRHGASSDAMLVGKSIMNANPVLGNLAQVRAGTVRALAIASKKAQPDDAGCADLP